MDRGVFEKEQALKIRRIVSQTKSKRRKPHFQQMPQHPTSELAPLPIGNATISSLPVSSLTGGTVVIQGSTEPHDNFQFHISEGNPHTFNEPMWSESFYDTSLPAESFFNQENSTLVSNQRLIDAATTTMTIGDMESNSALSEPSERASASVPMSVPMSPSACEANSRSRNEVTGEGVEFEGSVEALINFSESKLSAAHPDSYLPRESPSNNRAGSSSLLPKFSPSTDGTLGHLLPWLVDTGESIICGDAEDTLFVHYWDQVFYIQYPFYHYSSQGRGWIFSILRRARSAYHASLALSECHLHSTLPRHGRFNSSLDHLRAKDGHYDLALREMQLSRAQSHEWSGTLGLIRSVEALTCTHQLLFWEVCYCSLAVSSILILPHQSCLLAAAKIGEYTSVLQLLWFQHLSSCGWLQATEMNGKTREYCTLKMILLSTSCLVPLYRLISSRVLLLGRLLS
jgi:hypothetical protein